MAQAARLRNGQAGLLFDPDELPRELELTLMVRDADTIAELCNRPEGEIREDYALAALRIGVLALRQARGRLDGDVIQRESQRMLGSLEGQLKAHAFQVQKDVTDALKEYFSPDSGRFQERIERLIKKDGELEDLLRRHLGAQDSELSKTLANHMGQESPLLKLLSPQESSGVLAALRGTLEEQLTSQREHVLREFSLDNKQSALSRLVSELTDRHGKLTEEIDGKIEELISEFSPDKETSALNRLMRNVDRAQRVITEQFSLDNEASALSRLKAMLNDTNVAIHSQLTLDDESSPLARLKRELLNLLESQAKQSKDFQEEVKVTLSSLVVRRQEAARSTTHGREFEDAVIEYLTCECQKAGDIATPTGNTTGLIKNCKMGDCVIELGPESAVPGGLIAVEAKEDRAYTLARAREEIATARQNRGAEVGLFIFSKKSAPAALETFQRLGADIFVVWDAEDPASDLCLRAAIMLAKALCVRGGRQKEAQTADFEALDKAINEVERQSEKMTEIETCATTIKNSSEKILNRVRITRDSLAKELETLRERTSDLRDVLDARGSLE